MGRVFLRQVLIAVTDHPRDGRVIMGASGRSQIIVKGDAECERMARGGWGKIRVDDFN